MVLHKAVDLLVAHYVIDAVAGKDNKLIFSL